MSPGSGPSPTTSRRQIARAAASAAGAIAGAGGLLTIGADPAGAGPSVPAATLDGSEKVAVEQAGANRVTTTAALAAVPCAYSPTLALTGEGVLARTTSEWTTPVVGHLSLICLRAHNTNVVQGASQFDIVQLTTDTEAIDTGAALSIRNKGRSDAIYITMEGKPGLAGPDNAPTGIGLDINRALGSGRENSSTNRGTGLHVWDWSTTDQGPDGPRAAHFRKHGNPDSNHRLVHLHGNRRLLQLETADGPGYAGDEPVIDLVDAGAVRTKWRLTADGDQLIGNGRGFYFTMAAGHQAYLASVGNELQIRLGLTGLRILTNAGREAFGVHAGGYPAWSGSTMVQATAGPSGSAAPVPAAPAKYLKVVDDDGSILVIPAYWAA